MKECGKMICSTVEEKKVGPTAQSTSVNISLVKNTEEVFIAGMMAANTTVSGTRTRLKVLALIHG